MKSKTMMALGLTAEHIVTSDNGALMSEPTAKAFSALRARASQVGFELSVASGFRSYERQLAIFNAKWRGERPVLDDHNRTLTRSHYGAEEWLHLILRFSALPGTSRHHWGTDIDIFDPSLLLDGETLQLVPSEYHKEGVFSELTQWLDGLLADDDCEGFFRPYDQDHGGVSVEPWHLSFTPEASTFRSLLIPDTLRTLWQKETDLRPEGYDIILPLLDQLMDRYVV